MNPISFRPQGFLSGHTYSAHLYLNGVLVDTINNLVVNQLETFYVSIPGSYLLRVVDNTDSSCVFSQTVQALFPIFSYSETDVNCNTNQYTVIISISNPLTAGEGLQFGYSSLNDSATVNNWGTNANLILPADNVTRYVFLRNSVCTYLVVASQKSPCSICTLTVTQITFSCS